MRFSRRVLVRLYGEGVEIFFKREDEIQNFEWMSKHGQGPLLLGHFTSGRVEEFLNARTLSASDLRDPEISAMIATKMRNFHNLHVPGAKKAHIWQRLRNMLNHAKRLCSPKDVMTFGSDNLHADIDILEMLLSEVYEEIGFCHNDLQYGNIMMDEEQRTITFIDYEFASHNPIAYDLAYHFCDMEGDYHSYQPHIIHTTKYPGQFMYGTPGLEERQRFIRIYLSADGNRPSNIEVEQLVNAAEKYTLPCYLSYGLWGLLWVSYFCSCYCCY
ncbi:PREDICTED: probable choline kinase 2 [Lupinus angustifolius]|uniref:probable choline kinase 2 n=1 Tax=Lupinus angustifolius TaxID=3871 RepID=UPI00092F34D7|nr:PREDICTED: probable choline kinase 2 [Lupinus angustifolius]